MPTFPVLEVKFQHLRRSATAVSFTARLFRTDLGPVVNGQQTYLRTRLVEKQVTAAPDVTKQELIDVATDKAIEYGTAQGWPVTPDRLIVTL